MADVILAEGARHSVAYLVQAEFGVIPETPALTSLRYTKCSLDLKKDSITSQEIRNDRMITSQVHTNRKPAGDLNFEFSFGEYDAWLAAALMGTWQDPETVTATDISADETYNTFNTAAGDFSDFEVGDLVKVSGFTTPANNGYFLVAAVTENSLEVDGALEDELAGDTVTITRQISCKAGTTKTHLALERNFADIAKFGLFDSIAIDKFSLDVKLNSIVTGNFSMVARNGAYSGTSIDSTPTPSQSEDPFDSFNGTLLEAGAEIAIVNGLELRLDNSAKPLFGILNTDADKAIKVNTGRSNLTGKVDLYFQDTTILDKFINEVESSLDLTLGSGTVKSYRIRLPRIKYTGGDVPVDKEDEINLGMPFQALRDATLGTNVIIYKIA